MATATHSLAAAAQAGGGQGTGARLVVELGDECCELVGMVCDDRLATDQRRQVLAKWLGAD